LPEVFDAVAELDAAIAISSYQEELSCCTTLVFGNSHEMRFQGLHHPLIPDAVSNLLDCIPGSVLITGSNMTGKFRFTKTIGTNFILAQLHNSMRSLGVAIHSNGLPRRPPC
jgi:DNA mismatch repair ATPase MutS